MRFLETPVFTASLRGLVSGEQYRQLQIALLLRPEQGALIRGSKGLRKVRWGAQGRGKRGGVRLIYYWDLAGELFYMLYAYPKNLQDDLSPAQVRILRRLVEEELG
jgi:mRNA-degrading endonuclease RelE of RelBE toxin-antitoxin system